MCVTRDAAERWNSATPGRGLKPTRDFTANPRRFPALPAVIWFGNPRFIDSEFSGQNLQTRSDDRPRHCTGKGNRETREIHEKKSGPRRKRPRNSLWPLYHYKKKSFISGKIFRRRFGSVD